MARTMYNFSLVDYMPSINEKSWLCPQVWGKEISLLTHSTSCIYNQAAKIFLSNHQINVKKMSSTKK